MDQAFSSPSVKDTINLPPGSFSNSTQGAFGEDSQVEPFSHSSAKTLSCRQTESSADFLQKAAFPAPPTCSPFLMRKTSSISLSPLPSFRTNNRSAPRPCSGRVVASPGACVKIGAGLGTAALHRVVRGGGQGLYPVEGRSKFGLLKPSSHQRVLSTDPSTGAPIITAPPTSNTQYARFYVFDWDNTLCPTEWLCQLYARSGQNLYLSKKPCQALNSHPAKQQIEQLQQHVRKMLLKCQEKGEVAIMSNATTIGLIRTLRLLPVIQKTIDELRITIISARDMCEPHGLPLEDWKDTALIHMLLDFTGRHANDKLSVVTIGDQDFEHVALLNASEYLQQQFGRDSHPKCIKYVESPSVEAVIKQTSVFTELLDQILDEDSGTFMMDQDAGVWRA